jgi:N-acetylornithine carbamoyltransferase
MSAPASPLPHFLSLRDLSAEDWTRLLAQAERLSGPVGRTPLLAGRRFAMVFFNSSLRTRTSFEIAAFDLGAHAVNLEVGAGLWSLEHRDGVVMDGPHAEHVQEGMGVLSRMVDGLGLRTFAGLQDAAEDARDPILAAAARASGVPLLSLESAMDHPHQGLADALTVRRRIGEPAKIALTWAPHIKPLPLAVPHAALLAFAREGHEVHLVHPEGFDLDEGVVDSARHLANEVGGSVQVGHDREAALRGARVVYAKSWGARGFYGEAAAGAQAVQAHPEWIVDESAMAQTDQAFFMHCLPVRRGVVVSEGVVAGPRSLVLEQGAARLDVQKATLCRAMGVMA